jgi:Xaa-Pro aminopeptidase
VKQAQRTAVRIADAVLADLNINAGQTEQEVASQIKNLLKSFKARPAFRIIVASGKRAALPHGFATNKRIRKGDLVVIDFGALYNGYRSDISRTFIVGKPSPKQKKIYNIVKQAQLRAIKATKAGKACSVIDRAARDYIKDQGFGKQFIHTTGHGIGEKVHQAPRISSKNHGKLKAGTVITIEPGIYIKGWGGVRIEDMIEVTRRGHRVLTKAKK